MEDSEEISQQARPEKKPRVDADTQGHSTTQRVAVTKVLDDDDLLRGIIVRVGLPNTLVHAALVCKRWLEHASDRKFLRRFRELHPPRLLGYYITDVPILSQGLYCPRFVPMLPQPRELATLIRRLENYKFGMHDIMQCRNGSVFTKRRRGTEWTHGVHHPLSAQKGLQYVPPLPHTQDHNRQKFSAIISKDEGSSLSYLYLLGESTGEAGKTMARVYLLQDGVWRMHTSATCLHSLHLGPKALLVDKNIYVPTARGDELIVLDLTASSFSAIQPPQGVKYHYFKSMLSRVDDASSVYFIHVEEFLLRVWLRKGDNWMLVDTICLHKMLDTLGISDHTLENEGAGNVQIEQVGDNGQFVFLRMRQCIFYLDIKRETLCKVYENMVNDQCFGFHPFMMIWPPTFPALKDDPARMLLDGK
ncbi:unnamed protein product [Alopecurus aequalis]